MAPFGLAALPYWDAWVVCCCPSGTCHSWSLDPEEDSSHTWLLPSLLGQYPWSKADDLLSSAVWFPPCSSTDAAPGRMSLWITCCSFLASIPSLCGLFSRKLAIFCFSSSYSSPVLPKSCLSSEPLSNIVLPSALSWPEICLIYH